MVFSVHNNLTVPISVQSITSALDTTDYPAPPAVCAGSYLTLPTYLGLFWRAGERQRQQPRCPNRADGQRHHQNACKTLTYHFTYSGIAVYTDATSTSLTSSPNTPHQVSRSRLRPP